MDLKGEAIYQIQKPMNDLILKLFSKVEKFMIKKSGVERSRVEKSGVEMSGVEKSGVEMSFNQLFDLF